MVPQEATLPTTFAIAAGTDRDQEAFTRLTALDASNQPIAVREALVQVPKDRVAELKLASASPVARLPSASGFPAGAAHIRGSARSGTAHDVPQDRQGADCAKDGRSMQLPHPLG
jgi:hypothetical protein